MSNVNRRAIGRRSHIVGDAFEDIINGSCHYYRDKRVAIIEKTPEPMRPLKPYGRTGQFIACFEKQAQPDYKGVLCDGTAIIFEAKYTDSDRIQESVITETQRRNLDDFQNMGAQCFVMVSIGFRKFYRVPWEVFGNMKPRFGRKYMTEVELEPYQLKQKNGTLLMLEGVELHESK